MMNPKLTFGILGLLATVCLPVTSALAAAVDLISTGAPSLLGIRVPYAAAMTDGHTAPELSGRGPAASEIAGLWMNIKACLHASMLATKVRAHA
jgi:hypothetical protein